MFFQNKLVSVFLTIAMHFQLCESLNMQFVNVTLFAFRHPSNCKSNEYYNLDYFSCAPCDSKFNLQPSLEMFGCECTRDSRTVALYDSYLHRPICVKSCNTSKTTQICRNITTLTLPKACSFKYANLTSEVSGAVKHIRVYSLLPKTQSDCSCDLKYNYQYADYCIWKELLNNFLNYNAFRQRGNIYADLKFIAFCCQSLENATACNYLANLCVQSFFDTDKNSACSVFLVTQASDATLFSSMGVKMLNFKPFLFYKRGKDTAQEMEETINYPFRLNADRESDVLQLFSTEYSLDGRLIRWGQFRPSHVNLCGQELHDNYLNFQYFKNYRISCDLSMETIINLASLATNQQFFNVFLNYTAVNSSYMKSIPILIVDAFPENSEPNVANWQLVKRFQIVGTQKSIMPSFPEVPIYEPLYKLRLFKSIRILKRFELRCSVTADNKILIPLIVLNYHQIDISLNTSLNEMFNFELVVKFQNENRSIMVYKICLPTFFIVGLMLAVFKIYILKNRQNLECCDTKIVLQFFLHLISNTGNSFLVTVIIDVFYLMLTYVTQPKSLPMLPEESDNIFKCLIYSAFILKGFYFTIYYWKLAHMDIFFVDWERPKGYDASLHLKNNLETSSQCSSIRAFTENNVSAWRIFFTANQWIELSSKQKTSSLMQGLISLVIYGITTGVYSIYYIESVIKLFICIVIFSSVHIVQRIIRKFLIDQIFGCPLQKFLDICAMANVSIISLVESSYGFYLHGRSPHGFSDTDMSSMILQLQRESQNMCAKRGLLSDSDVQTYVMLPPLNLKAQIEKLLSVQKNPNNLSQVHFQKELRSVGTHIEGTLEQTPTSYNRVNRFFCAFIDHAIKDMDYIIKEKSFMENLLCCEFECFLTENKGTFYIDSGLKFGSLFLYGNQNHIFAMEMLILLAMNLLTNNFVTSIIIVSIWNKIFQKTFRNCVRNNVAAKTLIDQRFLMNI